MFAAAQFIIAKLLTQLTCPKMVTGERMSCACTVTYYSVIKQNAILSFIRKWIQLESVMLSGLSQYQKAKKLFALYMAVNIKYKNVGMKKLSQDIIISF